MLPKQRRRGGRGGRGSLKGDTWCHICKVTNPDHQPEYCPIAECHWCDENGHQKTWYDQYFCFNCNKQGHLARQCGESQVERNPNPAGQPVQPTVDETTDISNKEQLVLCLRLVLVLSQLYNWCCDMCFWKAHITTYFHFDDKHILMRTTIPYRICQFQYHGRSCIIAR